MTGKDEVSLATELDDAQRADLTWLIASAMVTMRRNIESSFDANAAIKPNILEQESAQSEKKTAAKEEEKIKQIKQQREKELSASEAQELKHEYLKFFDDWRGKVIERISEAIKLPKEKTLHQLDTVDPPKSLSQGVSDNKIESNATDTSEPKEATIKGPSEPEKLAKFYPAIETPLLSLPEERRAMIVNSILLLMLSLEHYVAPSRVLLLYLITSLKLPLKLLTEDEKKVAQSLLEAAKQMSGDTETQKHAEENQSARKWKVGLASAAGAALVGVTGGLAAPLIAAGLGSVMGGLGLGATAAAGYLGSVAGSSIIVGGLFGAYGGRMTGRMMDNYAKEVSDFAFLPVKGAEDDTKHDVKAATTKSEEEKSGQEEPSERRLRVTIAISGWLTSQEEVTSPWHVLGNDSEVFALRFELEALLNLGNSLDAMVSSAAWGYAQTEVIKQTLFAELMGAATWPLGLVQLGRVVDNPFSIARSRADKAGAVLADALINKAQGERPVNLIGYSLGARVIYTCLLELARRKAFGLVENAVLVGAPCPGTTSDWRPMRTAVSGRLVNVYSNNDYILAFLYRTASAVYSVAGLAKVEGLPSVENVDVSAVVSGHLRYRHLVGKILTEIGYEDLDPAAVQQEETAFKEMLEREKQQTYQDKAKQTGSKVLEDNPLGVHSQKADGQEATTDESKMSEEDQNKEKEAAEKEAQRLEKEVSEKTQQSMLQTVRGYLPSAPTFTSGAGNTSGDSGNTKAQDEQEGEEAPAAKT